MRAEDSACVCPECGVVCRGRFAGCAEVWARGPRDVHVVAPPAGLARRTVVPAHARAPEPSAERARNEVLAWLQAAFDGLRDELSVLAGSLARQQAALSDLAGTRDTEVSDALTEVRGWASELRNETLRLQGFEKAVADQLRSEMATSIQEGVDRIASVRHDDEGVRQALADVENQTAELRHEAGRLQELRKELAEQVRTDVARTVQEGLATLADAGQPTPQLDEASLAETIRTTVAAAVQQLQESLVPPPAPPPAPAPAPTTPAAEIVAPAVEPAPEAPAVAEEVEATPARKGGARRQAPASTERPTVPVALELPSGCLVGATLATAAVDAMTLARVSRRRRRLPAPPAAGLHRADPLLTDILRRLERFALGRRANGRGRSADTQRWGIDALPVGASGDAEIAFDVRELNGLALTGMGAADVARAMAVTFFCRHRPPSQVVLLGEDLLRGAADVPGIAHAATVPSALAAVGFTEDGGVDAPPPRSAPRQLILATGVPMPDLEELRQAVDQHPELGVVVVSVGSAGHDPAATVDIDAAGNIAAIAPDTWAERLGGGTLFSLATPEAAELVALIAASRREGEEVSAAELNGEVCHLTQWVGSSAGRDISVRMLGPFAIEVNGEEVRGGLRTKARELLAFYLLHPEGASLDAAVEALWPEADPGRGSEWFWTALGNLRSRLRAASGDRDLKVVDRSGDTYRIEVDRFTVDVWRFEEALVGAVGGDEASSMEALEAAVALYGGELLAGEPWQWVEGAREDLRRRAVDTVAQLADRRLLDDDLEGALAALEQGLEIDAIAEELYRRAMELQGRLARRDAIRGTFRLLQARLAAYGLAPEPSTERVFGDLVRRA